MADPQESSPGRPWLARYAWFTAGATWILIWFGGLVTSHNAGLSVPDWPNSYGYNMFFFPIKDWVGGIFYEHTHRLVASGVGLLTTILAVWLWRVEERKWMRWLGVIAFVAVVAQGVLGGLRVLLLDAQLGIFHATLGQLFFVLMASIALFTTRWWRRLAGAHEGALWARRWFLAITILVFLQLCVGATMRQQHAGLSIPDFPLAYGHLWPPVDPHSIASYNAHRVSEIAYNPITAFQVELQMVHRLIALTIFITVLILALKAARRLTPGHPLRKFAFSWLGLIVVQICLGAATIWTNKSADIATAHVAVGALCLLTGALATEVATHLLPSSHKPATARNASPAGTSTVLATS